MYLLFKSVDARSLGIIQVIGEWMHYSIGYIPDTHADIIDYRHLNPTIVTEEVAYSHMFIQATEGYISVRSQTPQNERLQILGSEEELGVKERYEMTAVDESNATTIMQEIMRLWVDEVYDNRMLAVNLNVSKLENSSWEQQRKEAELFDASSPNAPLLQALATARGITLVDMVAKVSAAVTAHTNKVITLLGNKQSIEAAIKLCSTISDCCRLMHNRFGVQMPIPQQVREGVDTLITPDNFDI